MKRLSWPFRLLAYAVWFAGEIVSSNVAVLRDNLTPGQDAAPGVVRYPTRCRTDRELTLLASCITLTPGTLALGTETAESGARVLFVHGMYAASPDALRSELEVMESRMLHAVRCEGGPS